ncbi:MAG: hypothetical protein K2O23_03020 [Anaeroplasmataceae bacterium]|nr:hypothetical protein [Anaeroplasmataceae bacterium]
MLGKNLLRELKQYVRRLWPYLIALVVMSVFTCLIFLLDKNPFECNASITALAFFVITALTFVVSVFIHAYVSFSKSLEPTETEQPNFKQFLWTHILAFMLFVIFTALLMLACVSVFAWEQVGKMFLALNTDWIYFIEFCIWLIIVTVTVYVIPVMWIVAFRYGKNKKLSLSIGIITLLTFIFPIVLEILLLIHSSSTDMPSVWATLITLLTIYALVDIAMYLLMRRTLKTAFRNIQIENEQLD